MYSSPKFLQTMMTSLPSQSLYLSFSLSLTQAHTHARNTLRTIFQALPRLVDSWTVVRTSRFTHVHFRECSEATHTPTFISRHVRCAWKQCWIQSALYCKVPGFFNLVQAVQKLYFIFVFYLLISDKFKSSDRMRYSCFCVWNFFVRITVDHSWTTWKKETPKGFSSLKILISA